MNIYDSLCLVLCVFAVFGGYIALRIAAFRALRRIAEREERCEKDCAGCERAESCPEKRTASGETDPGAKSDGKRD